MSRHVCLECDEERDGAFCSECGEETTDADECPDCGALNAGDFAECHACGYEGEE